MAADIVAFVVRRIGGKDRPFNGPLGPERIRCRAEGRGFWEKRLLPRFGRAARANACGARMKRLLRSSSVAALAVSGVVDVLVGQATVEPHSSADVPRVAVELVQSAPVVDGRLDEEVWRTATPATDFVQYNPNDGVPATERTEVRFAVDGTALYIGARMYDGEGGAGVRRRLVRRDQSERGDFLEVLFDTFHDHSGQTKFGINPAGVKLDAGQASSDPDLAWDPVWDAASRVDSLGWTAELRIPLSQLSFPGDSLQVWGLQIWRFVERKNELSMWAPWGKTERGGPARFGHLTNLRIGRPARAIEFLPYVTGRASYLTPRQVGSPFEQGGSYGVRVGGEIQARLTSTVTLTATINPDFGQVEVDPAVVNLSAFETFLPEKRPFFVEGSGLFGFGGLSCFFCNNASGMSLFYTRRIGRRPQGSVDDARFSSVPDHTSILGAAKLTGRTANGLEIGFLDAVTGVVRAEVITDDGARVRQAVEPLTNYAVGRVRRRWRDGNVTVGAIGTSVVRRFGDASLTQTLPSRAESLGVDWDLRFRDQSYELSGNVAFSNVVGDRRAILRLQRASARYLDRMDRRGGTNGIFTNRFDPDLTAMRGYGGYARLAKVGGKTLWEAMVNLRSPGFEVNDLAFQTTADYVWMNGNIAREWKEPTRYYRYLGVLAGGQQQYNFDGDLTNREFRVWAKYEALGYWWIDGGMRVLAEVFDDRLTRGGPAVKRPAGRVAFANVGTDSRKAITLSFHPFHYGNVEGGEESGASLNVRWKPLPNLSISAGPRYARFRSRAQFVESFADQTANRFAGRRVVFADLLQRTVSMETRLAATFRPTLTLEVFAQPLISGGAYSGFKEFVGPRTLEKAAFDDEQLRPVLESGRVSSYALHPDGDASTPPLTFDNPDFNLRSLRGSAVLRWEYLPGSTLYVVWQQNRSGREPFGDLRFGRDAAGIFRQDADNVVVIKAAHRFGR